MRRGSAMSGDNTRRGLEDFYRDLLPVHLYVLVHLKKARVDYAKMMAKISGLPIELINDAIKDLMELGLIERDSGSAIKRSRARFKKAFEVHKHHTYYRLSRKGELFVRSINEKWLKRYFNSLIPNGWEIVTMLAKGGNLERAGSAWTSNDVMEELRILRFITKRGKKTEFFKRFWDFLG